MSLAAGTRLGPYEIVGALGAGGMGEVYRARDSRLERVVAVKILPDARAADPELVARFEREAKAVATLHHPHICTVHDVGFEHGTHFIVMELVEGETLAERLRRGALPRDEALTIARQLCEALATAHAHGIIHRDLKPGNVILEQTKRDEAPRAKLLDFGLARWTGGPTTSDVAARVTAASLSTHGEVLGTVRYMAPEQLRGEVADQRSDIWAMGCVLYEMLTGADIRSRRTIKPRRLERVVARCLSERPDDRYPSATRLATALQRVHRQTRAKWLALTAALMLVVMSVAAITYLLRQRDMVAEPGDTARAPLSMVIADFENRTGEAVFDGALEHAIAIGLETASFVTVVPRQEALASAATVGQGLDTSTARLVAQRDGIGAVVAGVVSTTPSGYVVTTHILDPVPGTPIVSARQTATTKEEVLGAMAQIARELRRGLGDHELSSTTDFAQETFTTSSLEAAREYVLGQEASAAGRDDQALQHYGAAVRHDPAFGRAYAGLGLTSHRLGRVAEARQYLDRALSLRDRMTERERLRTEGLNAVTLEENYSRALEIFQTLISKYPADRAALNNLAVTQFRVLQLEEASATGRRVAELYPTARHFVNLALYAMYAGDLPLAAERAQQGLKLSPQASLAYLPLAISSALERQFDKARDAYGLMAKSGARGAALSVVGRADLLAMQGQNREASRVIADGLANEARTNTSISAALRLLRAELALQANDLSAARTDARAAIGLDTSSTGLFRAADILVLGGEPAEAAKYVDALASRRNAVTDWYRRILLARLGVAKGDFNALDDLEAALATERPMWIAHYSAGAMQLARGRSKEALVHLNWCVEHAAAASAAFLDDVPTLRYLAQATEKLERLKLAEGR